MNLIAQIPSIPSGLLACEKIDPNKCELDENALNLYENNTN